MTTHNAVYDNALLHMGLGEVNWTSDEWVGLTSNTAPTKADPHYSTVKYTVGYELQGTAGYTLGGAAITVSGPTVAGTTTKYTASATNTWTSATFSAYYTFVHDGATITADAGPLLCYHDMGTQTVSNGTLTITWSANGVFSLTSSAEA